MIAITLALVEAVTSVVALSPAITIAQAVAMTTAAIIITTTTTMAVIYSFHDKLEFIPGKPFQPSLVFRDQKP